MMEDSVHRIDLLARTLARQAGDLVLSLRFPAATGVEGGLDIDSKSGSSDLVTSADLASQKLIFETLSKSYPSHRLIGEEDAEDYGSLDERPTWIVDAIDGTTNFVHGLSDFAVSIAFAVEKQVEIGVVYNPSKKEMFSAVRGKGAYLNDKPIQASKCSRLGDGLILTEWGYVRKQPGIREMLAVNERLLEHCTRGVRQLGSGSLDMCYVAMGRADGVYCGVVRGYADSWKIWDYAAASVIATEAGAILRGVEGGEFDIGGQSMLCACSGVIEELLQVIKGEKGE